jgi:biopolymer transport protein ExbD
MATKRPRGPSLKVEEADMKPFMNLMVVLIPMLLLSAEFAKIAVIDIKLPENRGSQTQKAVTASPKDDKENKLVLTAIITDSAITIGGKDGFLPTIFYREFHKYVAKDDNEEFTVEYTPGDTVRHPKTNRPMEKYERYEILLYAAEGKNVEQCLYTKYGEMVTDNMGKALSSVNAGDTVWAMTNPRRAIPVSDPGEFTLRHKSAYDELKNRLMGVKERYREMDFEDGDDIIIAAEDEVLYDKIVQIMDAARAAEFPNISIAKLRG